MDFDQFTFAFVFTDQEQSWQGIIPAAYIYSLNLDNTFDKITEHQYLLWMITKGKNETLKKIVILNDTRRWTPPMLPADMEVIGITIHKCQPGAFRGRDTFKKMYSGFPGVDY